MSYSITKGVKFSYAKYTGGTLGTYADVDGLTDFPNLGASPEQVDVTTLADAQRHYLKGVQDLGSMDFTFLYEQGTANTNYRELKALETEDKVSVKVTFPDTSTFTYDAQISCAIQGGGVNQAISFVCSTLLLSDIVLA